MGRFNACSTTFAEFDPFDEIHEPTRMLRKDQGKGLIVSISLELKKEVMKGKYGLPRGNGKISL
jgi:hypothetical protein